MLFPIREANAHEETNMSNQLADQYTDKETGLTEKDQYFLSVLFSECRGNFTDAMQKAGINETELAIRKRLKSHIQEASKDYLATSSVKASIELVGVLADPMVPGAKNTIAAAKEILDRGGVTVKDETPVRENYVFILPAKEDIKDGDRNL